MYLCYLKIESLYEGVGMYLDIYGIWMDIFTLDFVEFKRKVCKKKKKKVPSLNIIAFFILWLSDSCKGSQRTWTSIYTQSTANI